MQSAALMRPRRILDFGKNPPQIAVSMLVAVVSGAYSALFLGRGFDLHHGGLIATKLIALDEGFHIHGEVFSQYGPLLTWSQWPLLGLGFSPIVTVQIWAVAAIGATTFFIADLGRVAPEEWRLRPAVSALSAVIWAALNATWLDGNLLGWSSLLGGLLLTFAFYLFAFSQNSAFFRAHARLPIVLLFGSGFLTGLTPFARINVGTAAVFVLVIVCVALPRNIAVGRRIGRLALLGGLTAGLSAPVLGLVSTGSLVAYWEQGVVGPLRWAQIAIQPSYWDTWNGLSQELGYLAPRIFPLFILMLAAMAAALYFSANSAKRLSYLASATALASSVLLALYLSGFFEALLRWRREPQSGLSGAVEELDPMIAYRLTIYFLMFAFIVLATITLGRIFWTLGRQSLSAKNNIAWQLMLWGLSSAMLIQVIPTYDPLHVWWGLPLALVAVFTTLDGLCSVRIVGRLQVLVFLLALLPVTAAGSVDQLSRELANPEADSMGEGALVEPDLIDEVKHQLEMIEVLSSAEDGARAYFMVRDGSLAAIDGSYHSRDFPIYVWWANRPTTQQIQTTPWDILIIDSWVWESLGFGDKSELLSALSPSAVHCSPAGFETTYCAVFR